MLLKGKSAIVTGGAGRTGKAIAFALSEQGASVVVSDSGGDWSGSGPDKSAAETVAEEIRARGGKAAWSPETITESAGAQKIVKTCLDSFGRVDILVNTAGIMINNLFLDTPEDSWDRLMAVHAKGTFLCSKYAGLEMRKQKWGRIINFVSLAGLESYPGSSGYAMGKAAVMNFTWTLALELAFYNVTVNAVAPKVVVPNRPGRPGLSAAPTPEAVRQVRRAYGIVTVSDSKGKEASPPYHPPEPVAALVAYLASEEASYVNGQIIGADRFQLDAWSRPAITRSTFSEEEWTLDSIRQHFRSTVGQGMTNIVPTLPS